MASMDWIEASRDVDRLVKDAESAHEHGRRIGSLESVTIEALREELTGALAAVQPLEKRLEELRDDAAETIDGMRDSESMAVLRRMSADAGADGEDVINAYDVVMTSSPEMLAGRLLELLDATVGFCSSREPAAAADLPAILQPLPPRTKRIRTGSTTVLLPFLISHSEGVNVAVNDPLPSPLMPVKRKPGRPAGSGKKAA